MDVGGLGNLLVQLVQHLIHTKMGSNGNPANLISNLHPSIPPLPHESVSVSLSCNMNSIM